MSKVFANVKKYEESWKVASIEALDSEDLSLITKAQVVKSMYGRSIKFYVSSGFFYIPMDERDTTYEIDEFVDLSRLRIKILTKEGELLPLQRCFFVEKQLSL